MEERACLLRHAVVGDVADESVPEAEAVLARRRRGVRPDQLLADERKEVAADIAAELGRAEVGDDAERELLADDRGAFEDRPLIVLQPVQPLGQQRLDRRRDDHLAAAGECRELLHVERIALCRPEDAVARQVIQLGAEPGEQRLRITLGQRLEDNQVGAFVRSRPLGPPLEQLRPRRADQQHRRSLDPAQQVLDEVEERRLGAVDVLEDEHDWLLGGERLEQAPGGPEELVDRPGRVARERAKPFGDGLTVFGAGERAVQAVVAERAQNLDERPEGDAVAVGEAAARQHAGAVCDRCTSSSVRRVLPSPAAPTR